MKITSVILEEKIHKYELISKVLFFLNVIKFFTRILRTKSLAFLPTMQIENFKSTRSTGVWCSVTFEICKNIWDENSKKWNASSVQHIICNSNNFRRQFTISLQNKLRINNEYTETYQNLLAEDILKILIFDFFQTFKKKLLYMLIPSMYILQTKYFKNFMFFLIWWNMRNKSEIWETFSLLYG